MNFRDMNYDTVIFSYRTSPVFGREGDDGGFSVSIHRNGKLQYCTYTLFDNIKLLQLFKMDVRQVRAIYEIIKKGHRRLRDVPERLENGSADGCINEFEFIGHEKIQSLNIQETFVPALMVTNHTYYLEYKENILHENTVMSLFGEICKYLRQQGIRLTLDSCEISKDFALKISW